MTMCCQTTSDCDESKPVLIAVAQVYANLGDKNAMVGALRQEQVAHHIPVPITLLTIRKLDPEKFLRAPRAVMEQTIKLLKEEYGGAAKYLESKLERGCSVIV